MAVPDGEIELFSSSHTTTVTVLVCGVSTTAVKQHSRLAPGETTSSISSLHVVDWMPSCSYVVILLYTLSFSELMVNGSVLALFLVTSTSNLTTTSVTVLVTVAADWALVRLTVTSFESAPPPPVWDLDLLGGRQPLDPPGPVGKLSSGRVRHLQTADLVKVT